MTNLIELRRRLHSCAEIAGNEKVTAAILRDYLLRQSPDLLHENIGGHGILSVYRSSSSGRTILIRSDMDAVPVQEGIHVPYGSLTGSVSHQCGHDGHMTILAGVAGSLRATPPGRGTVLLLFQPAEETGEGAASVLGSGILNRFKPDLVFGYHNLPGFPLGKVITAPGPFASASVGLRMEFTGTESHAAEPEKGNSPAPLLSRLISILNRTCSGENGRFVTITHISMGEPGFGVAPGKATVLATLRAPDNSGLALLEESVLTAVATAAGGSSIAWELSREEPFPATVNDPKCTAAIEKAAETAGLDHGTLSRPFLWSEDFGHFTSVYRGAMFGLGSGVDCPPLHSPGYDFPEQLIESGVKLIKELLDMLL